MHFLAPGVCTVDKLFGEMASCLRICKSAVICKKLWSFWPELFLLEFLFLQWQYASVCFRQTRRTEDILFCNWKTGCLMCICQSCLLIPLPPKFLMAGMLSSGLEDIVSQVYPCPAMHVQSIFDSHVCHWVIWLFPLLLNTLLEFIPQPCSSGTTNAVVLYQSSWYWGGPESDDE